VVTRAAALAAAAAALLSCDTNFQPQYLVRDLRILAMRAEVVGSAPDADADIGETVQLTALVANPGRLPGATVRWKACLPQQGESVSPCLDPAVLRDPAALSGPTVVDLGEGESVRVTIPAELRPFLDFLVARARATPGLACSLYAELPVVAILSAPGAATRVAVKTARVTPWREVTAPDNLYVRNQNPGLAEVRSGPTNPDFCVGGALAVRPCSADADCGDAALRCDLTAAGSPGAPGQCASALGGGRQDLCPRLSPRSDPSQVYADCQTTGNLEVLEDLTYQWYATAGTFADAGGGALGSNGNVTGDRVTFTPPPGPFAMWVIIRDNRGGVDWITRDFP
jgi:hypothetical protein